MVLLTQREKSRRSDNYGGTHFERQRSKSPSQVPSSPIRQKTLLQHNYQEEANQRNSLRASQMDQNQRQRSQRQGVRGGLMAGHEVAGAYESDSYLQSSKKPQEQRDMFNSLQHEQGKREGVSRDRGVFGRPRALINSLSNLATNVSQNQMQRPLDGHEIGRAAQDNPEKSRSIIGCNSIRAGANSVLHSNKENLNPNISRSRFRSQSPLGGGHSGIAPAAVVIRPSFAKVVDLNTSFLYNN